MTGTDFFVTIIAIHLLAHVSLQRTPLRSQHIFFKRSGSILMPFSKKASGWRRIHSRTVWMTASLSANRMPCKSDLSLPNMWKSLGPKSGLYGGCVIRFHLNFRRVFNCCFGRMGVCIVLKKGYPLSTCFPLGSDLFLHVCCQKV